MVHENVAAEDAVLACVRRTWLSCAACDANGFPQCLHWTPDTQTYTLTLYEHIKTAQQRTIVQQHCDLHTGRWWVGCYIWYSEEGPWRAEAPLSPLLAVPNVTAHPSTASVWWVGCYIWYSEEGPGRAEAPPSPLLAVPNVTAHPSTASVSTSYYLMWHYNCKGLI